MKYFHWVASPPSLFPSLSTWKSVIPLSSGLLCFDDNNPSGISIIVFLHVIYIFLWHVIFLSGCFQYFLFILYSQQYVNNVPSWGFLCICPVWSLLRFLDFYVIVLHKIWEFFSLYVFKCVFSPHPLFSWDLNYVYIRPFSFVSQVTETLYFNPVF